MYAGAQVSVSEGRPEGNAEMHVCPGRATIAGSIFPRAWEACTLKRSERANVANLSQLGECVFEFQGAPDSLYPTKDAVECLVDVMTDISASPGVRIRAAVSVIELSWRWMETTDFEVRLSALERSELTRTS